MQASEIEEELLKYFPNATIRLKDLTGTGDH